MKYAVQTFFEVFPFVLGFFIANCLKQNHSASSVVVCVTAAIATATLYGILRVYIWKE